MNFLCRAPILTMVVAATAIPVELRPFGSEPIGFSVGAFDVLANLAAYGAVGLVLGELGLTRAVFTAALISISAEFSQLVMKYRDPSAVDVITNVTGAILGAVVSRRWRMRALSLDIDRRRALAAGILSLGLVLWIWATAGAAPNPRDTNTSGTLEIHLRFDETQASRAIDSSGHGLDGKFHGEPMRLAGVIGSAVLLDGKKDWIILGRSSALRLAGSMTITAWIKSTSYPIDDAAIVSGLYDIGYQLDTTIDRGPRTIGFKLTAACGELMVRYGATPLVLDRWYHVAGVYDAAARTLDVYLNGKPDNGLLVGPVSGTQRTSRRAVNVGRRPAPGKIRSDFAGALDDVRIYSTALTRTELATVMRGAAVDRPERSQTRPEAAHWSDPEKSCRRYAEREDTRLPTTAAVLGILIVIACLGYRPTTSLLPCLLLSFAAGFLVFLGASYQLPPFNYALIPLTSLAGGASVAASRCREQPSRA